MRCVREGAVQCNETDWEKHVSLFYLFVSVSPLPQRQVLPYSPSGTKWMAGSAVEVQWAITYNHGGGYQYVVIAAWLYSIAVLHVYK